MKYIIELEKIKDTNLWKAKGANTLVFDHSGIKNILTEYHELIEHDGCEGCKYECVKPNEKPCSECKQSYMDLYEFKPKKTVKRWETYNGDFVKAERAFRNEDCLSGQPCNECRFAERTSDITHCFGLWLMEDIEGEE